MPGPGSLVLGSRAAAGLGLREAPGLELHSKVDFSYSFSKTSQINSESKTQPSPEALGSSFPASIALSFPFKGCSISSDAL